MAKAFRGERVSGTRIADADLRKNLVAVNRVTKVVKGGRRFSFSAVVVVGDGNGLVGYGLGKAGEAAIAISKGTENAKKNMYRVPVHKGTVPHRAYGKFGGGRVLVMPAATGTGVIAGGAMRAVLEGAGVQDCLAKSKGSSNPHNVVKATIVALLSMRDARTVARDRGINLEDLFKG